MMIDNNITSTVHDQVKHLIQSIILIKILYKITVYFRLVDEDVSEEAVLSISTDYSMGRHPIEIYR